MLDLAVLALHLLVLRLQEARFLLQLLVRLLQLFLLLLEQLFRGLQRLGLLLQALVRLGELFLLRLQLLGERLRLRQQFLRAHVRLDGVEHDADRLGELFEECLLDGREALERGELDHRHHLVLENDGQHHHVDGRGLPKARGDPDVVLRRLGDQDRFHLQRGLSDERLADLEPARDVLPLLVPVRRDQAELEVVPFAARRFHHEEGAVLRADERRQLGHDQP